jgi:N6-adenosine-specific RNA methylase IME4
MAHTPKTLVIDPEFKELIPPLSDDEFNQLEANLLRDGCKEPLTVWDGILIDGHNRHRICQRYRIKFKVDEVKFKTRDHAMAWIDERQLGRRNLDDDKRAMVADDLVQRLSKIAVVDQRKIAGAASARARKGANGSAHWALSLKSKTSKSKGRKQNRTRTRVAKEKKISDKKLRHAAEIKKADKRVADMVLNGQIKLTEGKKLIALPEDTRRNAIKAIKSGTDVRTAVREAKKEGYNARIARSKLKPLQGRYRIIYADPPWKYHGLNKADEYGHAEAHFECLSDNQLMEFKPDGRRLIKELADDNAILFMWVTAPLLERSFPIIKAWGFKYKANFVWDKVHHVMGFYNSVRHEHLLIATKGSCTPDTKKLFDSVQSIKRTGHSCKPAEFYDIIETLYDHGRKLEIFARSGRNGWDTVGNEVDMRVAA